MFAMTDPCKPGLALEGPQMVNLLTAHAAGIHRKERERSQVKGTKFGDGILKEIGSGKGIFESV